MSEPYAVLARRLLADAARLPSPPAPSGVHNTQGGAGLRTVLMNCSLHVRPFAVVTGPGRDADTLAWLGTEPVPAAVGGAGNAAPPSISLGSFKIDTAKWTGCYWCRARANPALGLGAFWQCTVCATFNCSGSGTAPLRCSCGNFAASFVTQERFEVRGAGMVAATPPRWPSIPAPSISAPPVFAPAPAPARASSSLRVSAPPGPPPLRLPGRR
jgi:hypothetical protein